MPPGIPLGDLHAEAVRPWSGGFGELWQPGEPGAHERLEEFLACPLADYVTDRDRPDLDGSSRLSPTCTGERSRARQAWYQLPGCCASPGRTSRRPSALPAGTRSRRQDCAGPPAPFSASSAGASSATTCWRRSRRPSSRRSTSASPPPSPGATTRRLSRLAARPHRATPSSTRRCASSGPPAGCTTARA